MTDRPIIYPGQIPLDTDLLSTNRFLMTALGYVLETAVGSTTFASGLACTPTSPIPDLNVHVARGCIGQLAVLDQNAYGSLPADTSDPLMKLGINIASTNFAITPPSTAGFSQNYLIEGQMQETDGTPVVLPYYNAAAPGTPYSGPANSGTAQNTLRIQRASLQLKAGTPAAAGSQMTPGADSGWAPLWIVSVNNGQTQITSTSISQAPNAPFIGTQSSQTRIKLTKPLTLYVSATGSDSNNGAQPGTPFLTLQAAWNALILNYDLAGFAVTISIGAGTFTPLIASGLPVGTNANSAFISLIGVGSSTIITGSGATPAVSASSNASVMISQMTVNGSYGITAFIGSAIQIGSGVTFGTCTQNQIYAAGGLILIAGNFTVTGSAQSLLSADNGGSIQPSGSQVCTLTGSPTYSVATAYVATGYINAIGLTFSGSANGVRYSALLGGAINTAGGGVNFFPGSVAGTTGSGTNIGFYA